MKYLIKDAGKNAVIKDNGKNNMSLEELQAAVQGLIQPLYIGEFILYCNDEGKLMKMLPNVLLVNKMEVVDEICGPILITKDDKHGGDTSLTDDDIEKWMSNLNNPEIFGVLEFKDGTTMKVPTIELG